MPTFLKTIERAHQSGDLADQTTLRQAMMYQNYLDAPQELTDALEALPEWPHLDPNDESPGHNATAADFSSHFDAGPAYFPNVALRRVIKARYVIKPGDITDNTDDILRNASLPPEQRVREFETLILPIWRASPLWSSRAWLYTSGDASRPTELMQDLGLHHYRTVDANDSIFRFSFEPSECRKPHWGDADLAFFFLQTREEEPHGWTLSLRTGRPTHPELLHQEIQRLTLTDVLLESVDTRCELHNPESPYWGAQRTRITEARP